MRGEACEGTKQVAKRSSSEIAKYLALSTERNDDDWRAMSSFSCGGSEVVNVRFQPKRPGSTPGPRSVPFWSSLTTEYALLLTGVFGFSAASCADQGACSFEGGHRKDVRGPTLAIGH